MNPSNILAVAILWIGAIAGESGPAGLPRHPVAAALTAGVTVVLAGDCAQVAPVPQPRLPTGVGLALDALHWLLGQAVRPARKTDPRAAEA